MTLASHAAGKGEILISSGQNLTIETATEFAGLIRNALQQADKVGIEFDPQIVVDVVGLQIICSACRTASAGGKMLFCNGPLPAGLSDVVTACGAERHAVCKFNSNSACVWFREVT